MFIECMVVVNVKKKTREKRFNVAEFILQTYDGWRLLCKRSWRYSKPCVYGMVLKCSGRMFGISLNNAIILIHFINSCFFQFHGPPYIHLVIMESELV